MWRQIPGLTARQVELLEDHELRDGLDADALEFMARDMAREQLWNRAN